MHLNQIVPLVYFGQIPMPRSIRVNIHSQQLNTSEHPIEVFKDDRGRHEGAYYAPLPPPSPRKIGIRIITETAILISTAISVLLLWVMMIFPTGNADPFDW